MTKHFHIVLWLPLLFIVLFMTYWISIFIYSYTELEEFILERQVQYATDSAIAEMLEYSTTDTDYSDGDFVLIEPELALNDFTWCMCTSLQMIPTEKNMKYLQDSYIRAMVICAYDGVYSYYNTRTSNTEWALVQTPKIPYFYTNESAKKYYALTLNPDKGYVATYPSGGSFKMKRYSEYSASDRPTNDLQSVAIIDTITDCLNYSLFKSYGWRNTDIKVEIPALSQSFMNSVNTIESPTILVVYQGRVRIGNNQPIAEVIGGSSIEEATHAVGYTFTGQSVNGVSLKGKFYATDDWWTSHKSSIPTGATPMYFDSVFDAAKAGYQDLTYLR